MAANYFSIFEKEVAEAMKYPGRKLAQVILLEDILILKLILLFLGSWILIVGNKG